jgi:hypothetical protein
LKAFQAGKTPLQVKAAQGQEGELAPALLDNDIGASWLLIQSATNEMPGLPE